MKHSKKGFTLVELLVVIAILAILATVSVVGYTSFIAKANLSNDQSAIAQANIALQAAAIPNGFQYPSDAIDELYKAGWNAGKMQPYSNGFSYAYNASTNKMYLIDEEGAVVYPEACDKSQLWAFYYNSVEGKIDGVANYIAMTHITNSANFTQAFGDNGNYTIDLNGYTFDLGQDNGLSNVTICNGAYISGTVEVEEDVKQYASASSIEETANKKYEYTVFRNVSVDISVPMSFENCIFYDCQIITTDNISFANCRFVGGRSADYPVFESRANREGTFTVNIINCVFDNVTRGINIANGVYPATNSRVVNISGCEFTGTTAEKHIIQYAAPNAIVNVTNCNFVSLGASPSIIRMHDSMKDLSIYADLAENITFTNNTIASSIPVEKYVDTDGITTDAAVQLDNAMTNKMK